MQTHGYAERLFKVNHSLDERRKCAKRMLTKYPDHVPIVMGPHSSDDQPCKRSKILVKRENTMAQLMHQVRAQLCLTVDQQSEELMQDSTVSASGGRSWWSAESNPLDRIALFLFVRDRVLPMSMRVEQVYEQFKDEDGILYVHYSHENTFG